MGFFKNLFEKKTCDLCGGEIGLLGNRKLEDGNCCKECAKKLSPWFTERKHSTVAEIRAQLDSREANRRAVENFHRTRAYGKNMMVYLDEDAGKFMVTDARDLEKANPDVLDFSQVTACDVDVVESRNEVYRQVRDEEGKLKNESFSPRRFKYSYDFRMKIQVNHPYIEEMAFSLSGGYFQVRARNRASVTDFLFGSHDDEFGPDGSSTNPPTQADFRENDDYVRYEQWGREIRELLMQRKRGAAQVDLHVPVAACKAAEQACGKARASGDPMMTMETQKVLEDKKHQLYVVYLQVLRGSRGEPQDLFAGLTADFQAVEADLAAATAAGDSDRMYSAANAKEFIMKRAMQARQQDPAGFARCGFLELLQKSSPGAVQEETPPRKVTCPYCGSQVDPGKFCGNCGAKLE